MKTKKIIALFACLCLTTGCASAAFAETVPTAPSMTAPADDPAANRLSLSDLVAQGIITQETADAITAYLTENPITPPDGQPGGAPNGQPGEAPNGQPGEAPNGQPGGAPNGQQPGDSSDAQQPDNAPSGENTQQPDGNGQQPNDAPDGQPGEAPNGQQPDGSSDAQQPGENAQQPGDAPDGQPGFSTDAVDRFTLEILLENEIITQDEYDAIAALLPEDSGNGMPGSTPDGNVPGGAPDGSAPDGQPGGAPGGQQPGGMSGQAGGMSGQPDSYDAARSLSEDAAISGETIESTGTDENALRVTGGTVSVDGATVTRASDDSTGGDASSFYGVGAAILATGGTLTVSNSTITTDANGGAGVFAYGDAVVTVSDATIATSGDTSGGVHVAGGGALYASNLTVTTEGASSAAVRSDRGGGTLVVDGGSYTASGSGSPAVYVTADVTLSNAALTATGSEALCLEGLNSVLLTDCDLTGDMPDQDQNDTTWTVILYQSMSGDSEVGKGTFTMEGGSLTSLNGGLFYTTNTESEFSLRNVTLTAADDSEFLLRCTGNANRRGWGQTGANGADCTFTAAEQTMDGDVIWDSISNLSLNLTEGSVLTGAILDDESCAGEGGDGACALTIDAASKWIVTGDSVLTTLSCDGEIVDADGRAVTLAASDGTVLSEGTSAYTVTILSGELA